MQPPVTELAPPPPAAASHPTPCADLLSGPWVVAFQPASTEPEAARFERLAVPADGWRVATLRTSPPPNSIKLFAVLAAPVASGDVALVRVEARATRVTHETAEASLAVTVQNHGGIFTRPAEARFAVGATWRVLHLPVRFPRDCPAGTIECVLGFGYHEQTVEIRDVAVSLYGPGVSLADLPHTRVTYAGRGADAAWRPEAEARIRAHRRGELSVRLQTHLGAPVPGARVELKLVRHAYEFGTCVPLHLVHDRTDDAARYREIFLDLFNAACPENDLKWGWWHGASPRSLGREATLAGLRWLRAHDITVRGHVFLWPSWKHLPPHIVRLRDTPEDVTIPGLIREHIADIASATRGLISEWDVVNEPFNHNDLMKRFGDDIMADWFNAARSELSNAPLFINDWGTHDIDSDPQHVAHFVKTARMLLDQGAPLGGLGLQSHIGGIPCPPASLLKTLDHYADTLRLPVRITEFDMAAEDEELQADYLRDFFTAVFSHPSTVGLQMWGFWAGEHWWPSAALYHRDWTEKANARALRELLKRTWHTHAFTTTDRDGDCREAGAFYGDYEVTITPAAGVAPQVHRVRHLPGAKGPHSLMFTP
ncbi:MAG: endo-1,4-beta-xylanase [Opitutaceae bacterium]|jgi:GH35 family endo-1,4-beta-xylanase|nr:endo-1,4-beta-xylanase [Opitutaceae bacterium]